MKNRKIYIIAAVLFGMTMAACQEWIQPENLEVKITSAENQEMRDLYLANLRAYKASEHELVYVTFDNSADRPANAAALFSYLPDSTDVVEVVNPDLHDWLQADMQKVQQDCGTRFVIRVSYDDLLSPYGDAPGQTPVTEAEKTEILDSLVNKMLAKVDAYGYDGITVQFDGTNPIQLKPDELTTVTKKENDFLPHIKAWKEANPDKMMFFNGVPTRTVDTSVPLAADFIIVPSVDEKSPQYADFEARNSANGEFTDAKMLLEVQNISLNELDMSTGYYSEGPAIPLMLEWYSENVHDRYDFAGLCVYNVEWDALSASGYYPVLKNVIKTLNPNS